MFGISTRPLHGDARTTDKNSPLALGEAKEQNYSYLHVAAHFILYMLLPVTNNLNLRAGVNTGNYNNNLVTHANEGQLVSSIKP